MDKGRAFVRNILSTAALAACKDGRVTLRYLETRTRHPEMVYSVMQWDDARVYFTAAAGKGGITYILRPQYRESSASELLRDIYARHPLN